MGPNIITIVIDDMGWRDLGCYGSTFYQTPHIDALAATGVRFTDAYAAAPVCSPTRASLLTGRYPARVGVTQFIGGHAVGRLRDVPYFHGLPISEHSLALALRDGGYATWHVGKWHLGGDKHAPELHGFDVNVGGGSEGMPPSHFSPYGLSNLDDGPDGEYLTDRLTDEAIGLISRHDGEAPFFLNLWHYAVHTPIEAPEEITRTYRAEVQRRGLDPDPLETGEPIPTWQLRDQRVRRRTEQSHPTYAAMIESLDRNVGRLVGCLRDSGRLDHTVIIFTSDNGGLATSHGSPTCNAPLAEGKGWMADGGVRVPLIVSRPGVLPAGVTSAVQFTSPDLYPTLLAAAGLEPIAEQHCDGVDLWPSWQRGTGERGPIFWHYPHYSNQGGTPGAAMRDGRFKLIKLFEAGRYQLYDLDQDVSEEHDLAESEPDRVTRMAAELNTWLESVDAQIPRPNRFRLPCTGRPRPGVVTTGERPPAAPTVPSLAGTWVPVLTPYDQRSRIDRGALHDHLQRIVAARPSGLYTHGTSGEFFNQTDAEWESVVERVASTSAAAGLRCQIGASHTAPVTAVHRIAVASRLRPAAIQMILPDWTLLSPDEVRRTLDGYQDAANGTDLVLYMPPHGKNQLSPEDLARLFEEFPALAGVKLADGDANWYQRMRPVLAGHAVYIPGHHLATGLAHGAAGSCSNVACLSPTGAVAWEAICRSDPDHGRYLEGRLLAFFAETIAPLQAKGYSGAALDKAMATAGGHLGAVGGMRWPLASATPDEISSIRTAATQRLPELFHPAAGT